MSNKNDYKISPATADLFEALKANERAREHYYLARYGEGDALEMKPEENAVFDAVGELIEKAIAENVRLWACSTNPEEAI